MRHQYSLQLVYNARSKLELEVAIRMIYFAPRLQLGHRLPLVGRKRVLRKIYGNAGSQSELVLVVR